MFPNATFPQKLQVITVLGEIGDAESAEHILAMVSASSGNRYLYQNTLLSLAKFEPTNEITSFVDTQLTQTSGDPLILRSSLAYYAQQPTSEAAQWVDIYAAPDANPDVRYAALYLGGTLGMDSVKGDIIELLNSGQRIAREYYLLMGLAEITTLEEFNQIIKDMKLNDQNRRKAMQYAELIKGTKEQREQRAKELLSKGDITQKRAAVDYLLENKDAEALAKNWQGGDGFVRGALKRSGLEIQVTEHGAQLAEHVRQQKQTPLWLVGLVLAGLMLAGLWWRQRRVS